MSGRDRIARAFADAAAEDRAALVIYLPAGFPSLPVSEDCLRAAADAGADVLEIGFPFSDPMMDGPTIQAASQVALDHGVTVAEEFLMCARLTASIDVPALVMTYLTIPEARGLEAFAEAMHAAELAGAILPDLPASEAAPWIEQCEPRGLGTVFLASSVSTDERLDHIAASSSGFVYAAGLLGVTGVKDVAQDDTRDLVAKLKSRTATPVAVGVGIKTPEDVARVATYADGAILGSSIVNAVAAGDAEGAPQRVHDLVTDLRAATVRG